ncbi:hypothetical protein [Mycoplasma sp. HF14]
MVLNDNYKNKLIKNLNRTIDELKQKETGDFKYISKLKKRPIGMALASLIIAIVGIIIIAVGAYYFTSEQDNKGVEFVNKVFNKYTETQEYGIGFMAFGGIVFVLCPILFFMDKNQMDKRNKALNDFIKDNKSLEFYSEIDNKVKKLYDYRLINLSEKMMWVNKIMKELNNDYSEAIKALEEIKAQITSNSDAFVERVLANVNETSFTSFIETI